MIIPEPERIDIRMKNMPASDEPNKRVLGFLVDKSEIECMGLFSGTLEKYCVMLLQSRGYEIKKKDFNNRLTVENTGS